MLLSTLNRSSPPTPTQHQSITILALALCSPILADAKRRRDHSYFSRQSLFPFSPPRHVYQFSSAFRNYSQMRLIWWYSARLSEKPFFLRHCSLHCRGRKSMKASQETDDFNSSASTPFPLFALIQFFLNERAYNSLLEKFFHQANYLLAFTSPPQLSCLASAITNFLFSDYMAIFSREPQKAFFYERLVGLGHLITHSKLQVFFFEIFYLFKENFPSGSPLLEEAFGDKKKTEKALTSWQYAWVTRAFLPPAFNPICIRGTVETWDRFIVTAAVAKL